MAVDDTMSEVISTYQSAKDRTRGGVLSDEQLASLETEVRDHLDALKAILNPPAEPASQTRKGASKQ